MRVPVYPFDLTPKRRFKRIAKVLRRYWPSDNGISLMTAQEVLAQGLGYRDFHDVLRSSENCLSDAPVPTLAEIRDNVSTSVFHFLKSSSSAVINDSDIERLVMLLPLHELLAFQSFRQGQGQTANIVERGSHSSAMNPRQEPSETVQTLTRKASNSPGGAPSDAAIPLKSKKYLSGNELHAIEEVVRRKAILRDRVLCSVLLSGIRQAELFQIKVKNVDYIHHVVTLEVPTTKSNTYRQQRIFTSADASLVSSYVEESGLSEGDYLFPSGKVAGHPMTSFELKKILRSWLLDAKIDPTGVSIHTIRHSVILRLCLTLAESTGPEKSSSMGHYTTVIMRYCAFLRDKDPK